MKKLLGLLLCGLILTGCSSNPEKTTTVCKGNIDEYTVGNYEIKAEDDKVKTVDVLVTYNVEDLVSEQMPIDTIEAQLKKANPDFESLKGVTSKWEREEEKTIKLIVTIDYDKADFDELKKANLITSSGNKEISYVSLEQTIKNYEDGGLTCKESK